MDELKKIKSFASYTKREKRAKFNGCKSRVLYGKLARGCEF